MTRRVAVVGGGLAGLMVASEISQRDVDELVILESSDHIGGVAQTIAEDGYLFEPGAGTFMLPHPQLSAIVDRAGIEVAPMSGGDRFVYHHDRLVPLRRDSLKTFARMVGAVGSARAAGELAVRSSSPPSETVEDFFVRRFGRRAGTNMAMIAATGVFAGDPSMLSVAAAFPQLTALEARHGSIVRGMLHVKGATGRPAAFAPVGGMATFARQLASTSGAELRTATPVSAVVRDGDAWRLVGPDVVADHVVLACGARAAGELVDEDLRQMLSRAVAVPVVVVGLGGPEERMPRSDGYGVLTTGADDTTIRGILFESSSVAGRAPDGHVLLKVIAGGSTRPEMASWIESEIVSVVRDEVVRVLGNPIDPAWVKVIRHRRGIPQYGRGHPAWLRHLDEQLAARPGLHVAGWDYRGIGVTQLAADAARVADAICND